MHVHVIGNVAKDLFVGWAPFDEGQHVLFMALEHGQEQRRGRQRFLRPPQDEVGFLAVKGAGPNRWQRYGERVLEITRKARERVAPASEARG